MWFYVTVKESAIVKQMKTLLNPKYSSEHMNHNKYVLGCSCSLCCVYYIDDRKHTALNEKVVCALALSPKEFPQ